MKNALIIANLLLLSIIAAAQSSKDIDYDVVIKNDSTVTLTTVTTETIEDVKEDLINKSIANLQAEKQKYQDAVKQKEAEIQTLEDLKKKIFAAKKRALRKKKKE